MDLLPEIIQSFLLGSSPSTSTLSSWCRSYTEVGRCELSTHLGGQQGRGSCKPTAVNSSVSSQAGREPAWAFNGGQDRGGGGGVKRPHTRTASSPSPSAGSLTLLLVISVYTEREEGWQPPETVCLLHCLLQPLAQSSWY